MENMKQEGKLNILASELFTRLSNPAIKGFSSMTVNQRCCFNLVSNIMLHFCFYSRFNASVLNAESVTNVATRYVSYFS